MDAMCRKCKKKGHIQSVCKQPVHYIADQDSNSDSSTDSDEPEDLYHVKKNGTKAKLIILELSANNFKVQMQLDTGSALSIAPIWFYENIVHH